jgi:YVTN family beta-propeller protein
MAEPPGTGATFAGYAIEREIGRGGMGVVYLAAHERLDRRVALKLISPGQAGDRLSRERFIRESRLAAAIEHPHAVPIYEAGEEDGTLFIAMRYVEGTDLRKLLADEQWLAPDRTASLLADIAGALDDAHARGLVHRDVKPGNILIGDVGGEDWAYLTDFGLTKRTTGSDLTESGEWVGTLDYVSPEQIRGGRLDARSDVYALGCVLFEALSGRIPFERPDDVSKLYAHLNDAPPRLAEIAPDLPQAIQPVIDRALDKEPSGRFPSAGDLARSAAFALGGEPVTVPERSVAAGEAAPGGSRRESEAPTRRLGARRPGRRALLAVAAGMLVAAALTWAGIELLGGDSGEPAPAVADTIPVGSEPLALAVGRGGVWVTNSGDATVTRINAATGDAGRPIRVGERPAGVALGGGSVWVADSGSGTVSRLDPETGSSRGEIRVGERPSAIRFGFHHVWVANVNDGTVSRINAATGATDLEPIAVGSRPAGITVSTHSVWVANSADGTVSRIAASGDVLERAIRVGNRPRGVGAGSDYVWVANELDGSVSRIEPFLGATTGDPIRVGTMPAQVAVGEGGIWVANEGDDTVSRIDPDSGAVTDTVEVGDAPRGVAVGDGSVWVANEGDYTVSRIEP